MRLLLALLLAICRASALPRPSNETSVGPNLPEKDFICLSTIKRFGDGNPHQNYLNIQLTENINCGGGGKCSVSHLSSHTIGFTASVAITPQDWISAGFSVQDSYTTGNTYGCGALEGDVVCVWQSIAHTAYTVRTKNSGHCGNGYGPPFVIKSPNKHDVGSTYYCVRGSACRSNGAKYWNNNGRAGGP